MAGIEKAENVTSNVIGRLLLMLTSPEMSRIGRAQNRRRAATGALRHVGLRGGLGAPRLI